MSFTCFKVNEAVKQIYSEFSAVKYFRGRFGQETPKLKKFVRIIR